jgi:hypothetical protein
MWCSSHGQAVNSSETSVETYGPTQYNNREDGDLKCNVHLVFDKLGKVIIS